MRIWLPKIQPHALRASRAEPAERGPLNIRTNLCSLQLAHQTTPWMATMSHKREHGPMIKRSPHIMWGQNPNPIFLRNWSFLKGDISRNQNRSAIYVITPNEETLQKHYVLLICTIGECERKCVCECTADTLMTIGDRCMCTCMCKYMCHIIRWSSPITL